jgi:hypothetical protein
MSNLSFYIKLISIGIVSPLIIYFLNELILLLSLDISISFFSFIVDNVPIESKYIIIVHHIYTVITYSISSLLIFILLYVLLGLDTKYNRKSISIITTICIIIFTLFSPYISKIYFDGMIIYYDLTSLLTLLIINILVIVILFKK